MRTIYVDTGGTRLRLEIPDDARASSVRTNENSRWIDLSIHMGATEIAHFANIAFWYEPEDVKVERKKRQPTEIHEPQSESEWSPYE